MRTAILLLLAAIGLSAQTSIFPAPQTGGSGTVTSVAATVPSWLTLAGSPITSTGTLAITGATGQTANQIIGTNGSGNVGLMNLSTAQLPAGITLTIASGTAALGTSAIASGACATAITATATGTATTDVVTAGFNGDPTAVTGYIPSTSGMLTIIVYPTANTVNLKVCNNTSASITPGAITLNWRVAR